VLHITNGDCAAERIAALALGGDLLPWRDVLHRGPVPAPATLDTLRPLRARFLAGQGGASAVEIARELETRDRRLGASRADGEVALWFEHDLYDQLQLAQVLDWFTSAERPRVTLLQAHDYLGLMDGARLRRLWERRVDVTDAHLAAGQHAWRAFTSSDPRDIEAVLDRVEALPCMRAALVRHLEEFPDVESGLSRTERQALETLAIGTWPLNDLFQAAHIQRDDPFFFGDAAFFDLVRGLAADGGGLVHIDDEDKAWLTDLGRAVLAGRSDRVVTIGIDAWLGGVRLKGRRVPFRWDRQASRIAAA
jgi:hypothetical protein